MLMEHLYALTKEEFDVFNIESLRGPKGAWEVTAVGHTSGQPRHQEVTVGCSATEEQALGALRLQLVTSKYGEDRG